MFEPEKKKKKQVSQTNTLTVKETTRYQNTTQLGKTKQEISKQKISNQITTIAIPSHKKYQTNKREISMLDR
jgi:hypothetical protein